MLDYAAIHEGFALPERRLAPLQQIDVVKYAGASGDFNQIHTVPAFAAKAGLPGTIAHGMMSMGFLGSYVVDWAGAGAELRAFGVRFAAMTFPGDELALSGAVTRVREEAGERLVEVDLTVRKQDGTVTTRGWATLRWRGQ